MRARTEVGGLVGALLAAMVALGGGTVALLARMDPAVTAILGDGGAALEAEERMLALLAGGALPPAAREPFVAALALAEERARLPGERDALATVRAALSGLWNGDPTATAVAAQAVADGLAVRRTAMAEDEAAAQRLASGGAWAATLLLLAGVIAGLLLHRRVERRLLAPLQELVAVLRDLARGDVLRRCRSGEAVDDLVEAREALDAVLDAHGRDRAHSDIAADPRVQAALVACLDLVPGAALLLAANGEVRAANGVALDAIAATPGLTTAWGGHATFPPGWRSLPLPEGAQLIVALPQAAAATAPVPEPGEEGSAGCPPDGGPRTRAATSDPDASPGAATDGAP